MKVYVIQRFEDDLNIFASKEAANKFYRNDEFTINSGRKWSSKMIDFTERYGDTISWYAQWRGKTEEELFESYMDMCIGEEYEVIE